VPAASPDVPRDHPPAEPPRDHPPAGPPRDPAADRAADRAAQAAHSVIEAFGHRLAGLPGTHLAARTQPAPPCRDPAWNYWWQAHYLDAVVDAGGRHLRAGDLAGARGYSRLGRRLIRSVWLRNGARFTNRFYDDMAWMILAAGRLDDLAAAVGEPAPWAGRMLRRQISARLQAAESAELGGGLYWTTSRDRKNVPATAPAAIAFARSGALARARRLVEWIYATLWDETTGLALDTAYCDGRCDPTIYSYNQGTLLGALLALGDDGSLARAQRLIAAVDAQLRGESPAPVLRTYGDGDGGLFTGILVRYLALAAAHAPLAAAARRTAAALVAGTAEAVWEGSEVRRPPAPHRVFSPDPAVPARVALPAGAAIELSPQLQAWTILEAAATLQQPPATVQQPPATLR